MSLKAVGAPRPVAVEAAPGAAPRAVVLGGRRRAVAAVRDEWLVLDPGRVAVVFHDVRAGEWFAHP